LNKREKRERKVLTIERERLRGDKTYKEDPTGFVAVQNIKLKLKIKKNI